MILAMSTIDAVRNLIDRLSPAPICDDCIAEKLGIQRGHANGRVRELTGANGFERRRDLCAICSGEKLVTRRVRH